MYFLLVVTLSGVTVESQPSTCSREGNDVRTELVTLPSGPVVLRDTVTEGGGWIIIQRRVSGQVDFLRGWEDYKNGFGDYLIGEFYLGNEWLYRITSEANCELRIDFVHNQSSYYAMYSTFWVGNESDGYRLHVDGYSGNAGDAMSNHNNYKFTTRDMDNSNLSHVGINIAYYYMGAWWHMPTYSSLANLNGLYNTTGYVGKPSIFWNSLNSSLKFEDIRFCEMRIRPI